MILTRVTITGADDEIDPSALRALSREFPFVEWGFLLSPKRAGTPRYPTATWIGMACHELAGLATAAHLCGAATGLTTEDAVQWFVLATRCQRIQLNGWQPGDNAFLRATLPLLAQSGASWIVQVRAEEHLEEAAQIARTHDRVEILFDPSGGKGLSPFRWPRMPLGVRMGYAGGITPDNVKEVLCAIAEERMTTPSHEPFWIDMESGVRSADRFDLGRVRRVLEKAKPFVAATPSRSDA